MGFGWVGVDDKVIWVKSVGVKDHGMMRERERVGGGRRSNGGIKRRRNGFTKRRNGK